MIELKKVINIKSGLIMALVLTSGCTFNFIIETDYASQNGGGGAINEEVTTAATTTPTVSTEVQADVKPGEL